jgi:non-ribosomal peptide synthetase component E (peptide arylation enzyme)
MSNFRSEEREPMPFDARFPAQGAGDVGRQAASLVDVLRGRAAASPDRVAFTFLCDGEQQTQQATYAQLDRQARNRRACSS